MHCNTYNFHAISNHNPCVNTNAGLPSSHYITDCIVGGIVSLPPSLIKITSMNLPEITVKLERDRNLSVGTWPG